MQAIFLLFLLLLLPSTLATCSDKTCRSSACCSEVDCISNPLDPDNQNAQTCPCMIPQTTLCISPGTTITLECDPGGVCADHCDWDTPAGSCSWDADSSQCSDSSIRFLNQVGTCNIQVQDVQSRHSGVWRCGAVPFTHRFSDHVNITVSTNCGSAATWWRSGWTAPVFWVAVGGLVILLIIIGILVFFFCCPWLCLCLPWCAQRDGRMEDRPSRRGRQEDTDKMHTNRGQRRSSHSPVIVVDERRKHQVDDRRQHQMDDRRPNQMDERRPTQVDDRRPNQVDDRRPNQVYDRRPNQMDDRRPNQVYEQVTGEEGLERHHQTEDGYEHRHRHSDQVYEDLEFDRRHPGDTLDYDVPRHYSHGGENMRTAKKKSNLATRGLEDRIRKASGVARQEQL